MQNRSNSVQQPSPIRQKLQNLSNPFEGLRQMEYQQVQPTILKKIKLSAPRPQKQLRTFSQQLQEAAQAYVATSQDDYYIPTIKLEDGVNLDEIKPVALTTDDFRNYMQKARNLICTAEVYREQAEQMLERLEHREQQQNAYNQYLNLLCAEQRIMYKDTTAELFSEQFFQQKQDVKNQSHQQTTQMNQIHSLEQKLDMTSHEIYKVGFKMEVQHASYQALRYIAGQGGAGGQVDGTSTNSGSPHETQLSPEAFKAIADKLQETFRANDKQLAWLKKNKTIRTALEMFAQPLIQLDINLVHEQVDGVRQNTFRAMQRCSDTAALLNKGQKEQEEVNKRVEQLNQQKKDQQQFIFNLLNKVNKEIADLDQKYLNRPQDISLINTEQLRSEANYELIRYSDRPVNKLLLKMEDLDLKMLVIQRAAAAGLYKQNLEAHITATIDKTRHHIDDLQEELKKYNTEELHRARVLRGLKESKEKQKENAAKQALQLQERQNQIMNANQHAVTRTARPVIARNFGPTRRITQQRIQYNQVLQSDVPVEEDDFYKD